MEFDEISTDIALTQGELISLQCVYICVIIFIHGIYTIFIYLFLVHITLNNTRCCCTCSINVFLTVFDLSARRGEHFGPCYGPGSEDFRAF